MRPTLLERFDSWMAAHPWPYMGLVVVASCLVSFLFIDLPLAIYLQTGGWHAIDPAFDWIGRLGEAEGYVLIGVLLYLFALIGRGRVLAGPVAAWYGWVARHCLLLFASLAVSAVFVHLIKNLLARLRPRLFFESGDYGFGDWLGGFAATSFPSGHSQTAFAVAAVLALAFPRWRWPLFILAGLVALSRMVNGAHFLSDVIAGAFISLASVVALKRWLLDPQRDWPARSPLAWRRSARSQAKVSPASTRA